MIISCFYTSVSAIEINSICDANIVEYKRENTTLSELHNADIISIEYDSINEITEYAKIWVDSGKILYITAPEVSVEEIALVLNIPQTGTRIYNSGLLFAYAIFKVNEAYVFDCHYAIFASNTDDETNNVMPASDMSEENQVCFDSVITLGEYKKTGNLTLDHLNNMQSVISVRADIEGKADTAIDDKTNVRSVNARSSNNVLATDPVNDTIHIYDSNDKSCGYIRATAYAYDIGRGYVNNEEGYMYVVAYDVKVYPSEKYYVDSYSVTMPYNITGHKILRTTTLESNVTLAQSIGFSGTLSTSLSLDDIGIGSDRGIAYDISWTHSPESQIFMESSDHPKIVTWSAEPVDPRVHQAFGMAPGGEIFVTPGYQNQRGLYIQVEATLKKDTILVFPKTGTLKIGKFF